MSAAAPGQGKSRHLRRHAGAVIDEGDRADLLTALVLLPVITARLVEDDPDILRAGLDGVVYDLPRGLPSGAVGTLPLRQDGPLRAEEREAEAFGQAGRVVFLPLDLREEPQLFAAQLGPAVQGLCLTH